MYTDMFSRGLISDCVLWKCGGVPRLWECRGYASVTLAAAALMLTTAAWVSRLERQGSEGKAKSTSFKTSIHMSMLVRLCMRGAPMQSHR